MAVLIATFTPQTAPALNRRYAGPEGKSYLRVFGTLVVTQAGGAAVSDIPASLFGLNTFVGEAIFVKSDNSAIWNGVPDATNGKSLLTTQNGTPTDLPTGTWDAIAEGISA